MTSCTPSTGSPARPDSGAAAIEFALVASVLMLLLFGLIEFARLVSVFSGVETASREAARYGSAVGISSNGVPRYADCGGIRDAGTRLSGLAGLQGGDIQVTYDAGPGSGTIATCPAGGAIDPQAIASGSRVVVRTTTTFDSFVPFLNDMQVTSTERRTIFRP